MEGDNDFYPEDRKKQNVYIQNDSELVHSFSQPDASDYHEEFKHINKDVRMANTNDADSYYLNLASPLCRGIDETLGHNAHSSLMLKHDISMCNNSSVGRKGFGMTTLITKRQEQRARVIQDSAGFFNKKDDGGGQV